MKENFDKKIGQPRIRNPEGTSSKLQTAPKSSSSLIGPIAAGIATAVCVITAGGKTANAEPVKWTIGMPFGDDVNDGTETTFRGITPGEKPNRFRLTYSREPTDISANEYVYDKWIEIDDGPDNAVVVRELSKAEFVIEYPNPQYGYYGHPKNNLEYCIDGVTYKIQGFPASLQLEKNGILVNGQPVWNPYPYPDGLDSWTTIDEVTRSADPTKLKINASPFIPNGDWENNPWYYSTWKVDIAELNYYDAIQKVIDKAWAEGKDPYEAGLTNSLDGGNAKGGLIMSPETERVIAMTRTGYNDINYSNEYTYFFLRDAITNQYMPLKRNSGGMWSLEDNINDGFGEADFIYGISCNTESTPVGALSRETPQGGKENIFILKHCGTVGSLILEEQPDNLFTEPTLIHEEDSSVDVSGESILCVNSAPIPGADEGPEQAESAIVVEQPSVMVEVVTAVEENTGAETTSVAEAPTPPAEPLPESTAESVAEPAPDVVEIPQETDTGSVIVPPIDVTVSSPETDVVIYTDTPTQNPDTLPAESDTSHDTSPDTTQNQDTPPVSPDTSPDTTQNQDTPPVSPDTSSDIQPDSQLTETPFSQDSAQDTATDNVKTDTSQMNPDIINHQDTNQPDASQPSGKNNNEGGSNGCSCDTTNNTENSIPLAPIATLITVLASRLRRKLLPTTDR